jgi:peptide-methionine (R)-S-oxide reductase
LDSRTGRPSFWRPIAADRLDTAPDYAKGEARAEVMCHDCVDDLGRAFNDGPPPTGLRFRLISAAPKFVGEPTRPLKQPDRVLNDYLE